ncbi:MAG: dTDP-4-dehydrorhamnose reductase [Parcubacteria group bacterium]|nr:dTDP-4-dehydrorhamnose reductase [Parcubacteria group bacterium]
MKTLIIGAQGMLGHELAKVFAGHKLFLWDLNEIDITNQEQVNEKIGDLAPELLINAAAYTNVDACETNEGLATRVNGTAVGYLAEITSKLGATLVHYSTDYVFDGAKHEGYAEDDAPNPINAYGRSKLAGERAVQSSGLASWYVVRTAWLYGIHGKNFVETMLALADKGEPIKVVDDQIGSPTYAPDLAVATLELVESKKPSGIYHRTNDGVTSWYGFAKEIFKVFTREVDLAPCASADYPRPAKRPSFSVLQSTKLPPLRPWQEALRDYVKVKV